MERLLARQASKHWTLYQQRLQPQSPAAAAGPAYAPANLLLSQPPARLLATATGPDNRPKGFFERFIDNIKTEWSQNKEIKESLHKFRQETQKLEDTDAIRQAREKYKKVEEESVKDMSEVLQSAKDSLRSGVEKAKETEFVRKMGDKISTGATKAAEGFTKQGDMLKETSAYKKISMASKSVEQELDNADILSSLYKAPQELLKRSERSASGAFHQRQVQPNDQVQSVELHKDSKWSQSWRKFKDENSYINTVFELKMKYDESDNPLVRVTRNLVDRVSDTVGGLFKKTEISEVLTEICKVDPNFELNEFLNDCEKFIIPTILEAMIQDRQDVLADWCHEAVFNTLSQPQTIAKKSGLKLTSRILDIQNVELAMAKMMDQGPVLVITFHAHQLSYVTNPKGAIVEGDKDKVVLNTYVMAFCRDENDLDPSTAWRLIDVAMQQSDMML